MILATVYVFFSFSFQIICAPGLTSGKTNVASLAAGHYFGVAKEAKIIPYKVRNTPSPHAQEIFKPSILGTSIRDR